MCRAGKSALCKPATRIDSAALLREATIQLHKDGKTIHLRTGIADISE